MILSPELVISILLLWLLIAMLLSPLEALGWWAGWFGVPENAQPLRADQPATVPPERTSNPRYYVAYLTGIASVAEGIHLPREQVLLTRLHEQLPEAEIVDDIFPYSVTNRALTGQRVFAWFWRYIFNRKTHGSPVGFLINLRNLFQVLVSADNRYGPIYNQGAAQLIWHALKDHGYPPASGIPLVLIGYSGGGQICLGAASYLKDLVSAPISLISLGGVLCADPSLADIEHLYHVEGSRDWVQRIGAIVFPGRWPMLVNSDWNTAKTQEKITIVRIAGVKHTGASGYLDGDTRLPDGQTYLENTVDTIVTLVNGISETSAAAPKLYETDHHHLR